jgi:hypothetical protein
MRAPPQHLLENSGSTSTSVAAIRNDRLTSVRDIQSLTTALSHLGSGLIDQSQKATAAAIQIAEK